LIHPTGMPYVSPPPTVQSSRVFNEHAIAYARLNDAVLALRTSGRDLVEREPKYARTDPNCCLSQIRERRIHWTGSRFKTTVRVRRA